MTSVCTEAGNFVETPPCTELLLPNVKELTRIYLGRYPNREPAIQIQAFNNKVSREHAVVSIDKMLIKLTIKCLSKNGLFINNNFVDQNEVAVFKIEDSIFIGNTLYKFCISDKFKNFKPISACVMPTSDDNLVSNYAKSIAPLTSSAPQLDLSSEMLDIVGIEDKENLQFYKRNLDKSEKFCDDKAKKKLVQFQENLPTDLPSNVNISEVEELVPENLVDLVIESIALSGQSHLSVSRIQEAIELKYPFQNLKFHVKNVLKKHECFECRSDSGVTSKVWTYVPNLDFDVDRGILYSHCMSQMPQRRSKMGIKRYYFQPVSLPNEKKKKRLNDDEEFAQ
eukprot:NODE_100_length_20331_cov_1.214462.p9 type:complete len:339 gc:universal NODE_100_length_20331_cov_1.214462:2374-3390(+)